MEPEIGLDSTKPGPETVLYYQEVWYWLRNKTSLCSKIFIPIYDMIPDTLLLIIHL